MTLRPRGRLVEAGADRDDGTAVDQHVGRLVPTGPRGRAPGHRRARPRSCASRSRRSAHLLCGSACSSAHRAASTARIRPPDLPVARVDQLAEPTPVLDRDPIGAHRDLPRWRHRAGSSGGSWLHTTGSSSAQHQLLERHVRGVVTVEVVVAAHEPERSGTSRVERRRGHPEPTVRARREAELDVDGERDRHPVRRPAEQARCRPRRSAAGRTRSAARRLRGARRASAAPVRSRGPRVPSCTHGEVREVDEVLDPPRGAEVGHVYVRPASDFMLASSHAGLTGIAVAAAGSSRTHTRSYATRRRSRRHRPARDHACPEATGSRCSDRRASKRQPWFAHRTRRVRPGRLDDASREASSSGAGSDR